MVIILVQYNAKPSALPDLFAGGRGLVGKVKEKEKGV
jgi:hypothetical protein